MKTASTLALVAGITATLSGLSQAQTFNRLIGTGATESANGIAHTTDGGYATVGAGIPAGSLKRDILVVKYDAAGNVQWSIRYGGTGDDVGFSIEQTSDRGFIIGAETDSVSPTLNLGLLKLDAAGNFQWSWVYEGDTSAEELVHTNNAGVAVAIAPASTVAGLNITPGYALTGRKRVSQTNQRAVLVRTDINGAPIFNYGYDDNAYLTRTRMTFSDVAFDADGSLVVVGTDTDIVNGSRPDPTVVRFSPTGVQAFAYTYPSTLLTANTSCKSGGYGLTLTNTRDIIFNGPNDMTVGAQNLETVRLTAAGVPVWTSLLGQAGPGYRSIHLDPAGNIAQSGWVGAYPTASRGMLSVLDPAGNPLMQHAYDYLIKAEGNKPCAATTGYALAGTVTVAAGFGNADVELIHTDAAGWVGCLESNLAQPRPQIRLTSRTITTRPSQQTATQWQAPLTRLQLADIPLCLSPSCPACAADYNDDGGVDGDDIRAFFDAWTTGESCADVNADGGIDFDDINEFYSLWGAGGC
jgi:hypothetical protein